MNITHDKDVFTKFVEKFPGHGWASVLTVTEPKMRKTGNPYNKITKISRRVMGIGYEYPVQVNNEREREGIQEEYKPQPLKWGKFVEGSKTLIEHKGNKYVRLSDNSNTPSVSKYYDENGNEVAYEDIKPFLQTSSQSKQQKTEKTIIVNSIKVDNIKEFKIGDFHFTEN